MVASTGHKEHESEVFGALASHLSAEGAGLAGGPSLGAPKAKARRFAYCGTRDPPLHAPQPAPLHGAS